MECYFIITTYIHENKDTSSYAEYIKLVKPIVESYGGKYIVRSNDIESINEKWNPDRLIIIKFPSRDALDNCFGSDEYKKIISKRESSVDARAIIVRGCGNE